MQELNNAIDDIQSKGKLSNGITTRYAVFSTYGAYIGRIY